MDEEKILGIERDYRLELVKKNKQYYSRKFAEMDGRQARTSWNWVAFALPFAWFAYRKLYLECIAYYLIINGLNWVAMSSINDYGVISNIAWIIDVTAMIFSGLYGNWLYKVRIERQVEKIVSLPEERREIYLKRHGGTSVAAIITAFAASILIAAILYWIYYCNSEIR